MLDNIRSPNEIIRNKLKNEIRITKHLHMKSINAIKFYIELQHTELTLFILPWKFYPEIFAQSNDGKWLQKSRRVKYYYFEYQMLQHEQFDKFRNIKLHLAYLV